MKGKIFDGCRECGTCCLFLCDNCKNCRTEVSFRYVRYFLCSHCSVEDVKAKLRKFRVCYFSEELIK